MRFKLFPGEPDRNAVYIKKKQLVVHQNLVLFLVNFMASWAVAYRVTSAPVGLLIGDVAPLRAQPTMLETECVYILSLNSLVMDLTTLITESSYWPRNVGGTLSVFSHAGVAASRNKQKFLFFELSSLFIMRGGWKFWPSREKLLTCVTQTTSVTRNTAIEK